MHTASTAALKGLRVAMTSVRQNITELSGGNQQKVLVGRALLSGASTYVLDEPTHGMDLLAKRDLVDLIRRLANDGAGVLWISSDIDEVVQVCDRVLVMHEGRLVAECKDPQQTNLEALVGASFGRTLQPGLIEIAH
jgi:ABC-type sugar transport system ATPase subunit